MFLVRSGEQSLCPCCNGALKIIGSRRRNYINGAGDHVVLIVRRLKCEPCKRVHHELPDILVPYKRYSSESIEAVVTGGAALTVAADESTIGRWKQWFWNLAVYFLGCLISIAIRYTEDTAEERSELPQSPLQRIWLRVGDGPGWLARIVRSVVNANLWVQTRSAFMSG